MHTLKRLLVSTVMVAALGMLLVAGCGKKEEADGGGSAKPKGKDKGKGPTVAKLDGYATSIKGKVTYNGPAGDMKVNKATVTKDQDKCPAGGVDADGWYVKDSASKGVRYAVVFLKAPSGTRFPEAAPEVATPAKPEVEVRQPHCQFEPRVLVVHPAQKVRVFNDSNPGLTHDSQFDGAAKYTKTMPQNSDSVFDLEASSSTPYKMSCGQHPGFMSAYVWKFTHPYAVATDENGNYELKQVPVISGGKMEIWVWHEMLPDNKMKKVGTVDVGVGASGTLDIAIPN